MKRVAEPSVLWPGVSRAGFLTSVAAVVLCGLAAVVPAADFRVENDGPGNLRALDIGGQRLPFQSSIRMPIRGWPKSADTRWSQIGEISYSQEDGVETWSGPVWESGGPGFTYTIVQRWIGDRIQVTTTVRSSTNLNLEGVFLFFDLPQSVYLGGTFAFRRNGQEVRPVIHLPEEYPGPPQHLASDRADELVITDASGRFTVTMGLVPEADVTLQDNREWGVSSYSFFFPIHSGNLPSGQSVSFTYTLLATGEPDTSPVTISLGEVVPGKRFDGWGGNFVFGLSDCAVPEFMLTTTRTAWARSGMSLHLWEPRNDNDDPETINWDYFNTRVNFEDAVETDLEREMRMAARIAAEGIPHIISVWYLPRWLQPGGDGTAVDRAGWPELMESVASYLLFLRDRLGVEPDYFSFNEPDLGVYLLQSSQEHADWIRQFGAYLEQLGLKTKLLLGDTANASNPAYAETAGNQAGVLDFARALAFHSWNGTTPENYRKWSELAETFDIPLLVTEVGSDPAAWHYPGLFFQYGYALDDLANYFGFLRDARPRAALQWEYTCDYPVVEISGETVRYTARYWFIRQLGDRTPPGALYLEVDSSSETAPAVAFRDPEHPSHVVVHVANLGPERTIHLSGLPPESQALRGVFTARDRWYAEFDRTIPVSGGEAEFVAPAQSLVTLESLGQLTVLPHFGSGLGMLRTQVNVVNLAPDPAAATLVFRNPGGETIHPPLLDASEDQELPPRGMAAVRTDPETDHLYTGWVGVYSDQPVAAGLLFAGAVGAAGVVPGPALPAGAFIPVEYDRAAEISTGVALANPQPEECELTVRLYDAGGNLLRSAEPILVPGYGHLARFVDELPWTETLPENFTVGLLEVVPTLPVAMIALRTQPGEFVTLPVVPRDLEAAGDELRFAQVAHDEGLLSSRLWLVNPDPEHARAIQLAFSFDDAGYPGPPPNILLNGTPVDQLPPLVIPPRGLLVLDTAGSDSFVGTAHVWADGPVGGTLLFSGVVGAAAVGPSPAYTGGFLAPVPGGSAAQMRTGLALWNLGAGPAQLTFSFLDTDGTEKATAPLTLDPGEHRALFLDAVADWSPGPPPDGAGVVRVASDQPLAATILVTMPGTFATLPVVEAPGP
ncbi:MAG: hypothetical protein Kow00109_29110 [Acidobacteriota bacterium]